MIILVIDLGLLPFGMLVFRVCKDQTRELARPLIFLNARQIFLFQSGT